MMLADVEIAIWVMNNASFFGCANGLCSLLTVTTRTVTLGSGTEPALIDRDY